MKNFEDGEYFFLVILIVFLSDKENGYKDKIWSYGC